MSLAPSTPLAEVTTIALRVLIHEMGIVNTARFINQFTTGYGDYVQEKEHLFGTMTVDELVKAIQEQKRVS
jgi:Mg/Co/Ni transporter MgtE